MYMPNVRILRLEPNATYIPLTCVWVSLWVTQILGLASGVFAFLDTNMLVSFALGDAKFWRWGHCPTPTPDARYFALQWNIGLILRRNQEDNNDIKMNKPVIWCRQLSNPAHPKAIFISPAVATCSPPITPSAKNIPWLFGKVSIRALEVFIYDHFCPIYYRVPTQVL